MRRSRSSAGHHLCTPCRRSPCPGGRRARAVGCPLPQRCASAASSGCCACCPCRCCLSCCPCPLCCPCCPGCSSTRRAARCQTGQSYNTHWSLCYVQAEYVSDCVSMSLLLVLLPMPIMLPFQPCCPGCPSFVLRHEESSHYRAAYGHLLMLKKLLGSLWPGCCICCARIASTAPAVCRRGKRLRKGLYHIKHPDT